MNIDKKCELEDKIVKNLQTILEKLGSSEPILGEASDLSVIIESHLKDFDKGTQRKLEDLLPRLKEAIDREFRSTTL